MRATARALAGGGLVDWTLGRFLRPEAGMVVTGFWRSGTTFLLEQLTQLWQAKPLFEPFQPELPDYRAILDDLRPAGVAREDFDLYFMPFAMDGALASYMEQTLRYRIVDERVQRSRSNLIAHGRKPAGIPDLLVLHWLAARPRVVVKFVRGTLLVPALRAQFGVPVFHIRRQPHGVFASFKSADWSEFQADRIRLRRLLLEIDDGRTTFFRPLSGLIDELDDGDRWQRLIGYWALTEKFVDAHREHYTIVPYKALATGEYDLAGQLARDGFACRQSRSPDFNSSTTSAHGANTSAQERAESWRHELSDTEIRQVDDIVARVNAA